MATGPGHPSDLDGDQGRLRIYLLPNLLTAANLFCGFKALTLIVEADPTDLNFASVIRNAIVFIILACVFDLLDGRVARLGGQDSPFGREFDSLADIISFGAAPAFLVHRVVLRDSFIRHPEIAWFIASIYLVCGAFRLARFNCLAAAGGGGGKDFLGFPIPAAAGTVASITLFLFWWDDKGFARSQWRFILPVMMVFVSFMMVSQLKYPSFKSLDWRATRTFPKMVAIILLVGFVFIVRKVVPVVLPLAFTAYLVYGFIRPRLSRKMRREIEQEEDEEEEDGSS
jgi:CDP-diacylglycerol--serine O-phosphatidyltransferase